MNKAIAVFALLWCTAFPATAHEVRPAYLRLRQTATARYDVLWKVPAAGEGMRLGVDVVFPGDCRTLDDEPVSVFADGAHTLRYRVQCAGDLTGRTVRIAGLSATLIDVLARVERPDGSAQVARLTPSAAGFEVVAAPSTADVARTYLHLGVEHILGGVDHLLFVLSLLLLVPDLRRIVLTVTAFTVAHSVTLAAAVLGFVHVPQKPVEAVIALSIVFVASEILRGDAQGLARRAPWLVAFSFGLLHGFGFAGALSEVGLPQTAIPVALLFFNLGVELGQLLFVAVVVGAMVVLRRTRLRPPFWLTRIPPYAIGTVAMFWVVERIAAF